MSATIETPLSRTSIERGWIVGVAAVAIVVGVVALLIPEVTQLVIAILFGINLVASGVFRLILAFTAARYTTRVRWVSGILGGLVLIAGILCLSNPWGSLVVLGIVIGFGWILDGIISLFFGGLGSGGAPRWLTVVAGIASIMAGILIMIMPVLAIETFILVGAVLLIVIGITTLFMLPRAAKAKGDAPASPPAAAAGDDTSA